MIFQNKVWKFEKNLFYWRMWIIKLFYQSSNEFWNHNLYIYSIFLESFMILSLKNKLFCAFKINKVKAKNSLIYGIRIILSPNRKCRSPESKTITKHPGDPSPGDYNILHYSSMGEA